MRAARLFIVWWKKKKRKKDRSRIARRKNGENWQGSTVSRAIISSSKFDDIIRVPDRHNNCCTPLLPPSKPGTAAISMFHHPRVPADSRLGKLGIAKILGGSTYVFDQLSNRCKRRIYIYIFIGIFLWGLVSIDL